VVRALQDDLPLAAAPFQEVARSANMSVEHLLAAAQRMQQAGQMRRLAAILHHRAAGFAANAMGVWSADADRVEEVGRLLASFRAVSHCYQRPTWPDWPFNLFTMVHGHTPAECEAHLAAMRAASGIERMAVLYSLEEYKKTRLRYFTGEIEAWEAEER
jgi:DNA-binding Lrp family transcriptional regulator